VLELVLRLGFSLAAVLGLFWLVAHLGSRRLGGTRALLHVRARQSLSRTASVAVVEVGDRVLVVGVADGGVRLLTELDPTSLPEAPSRRTDPHAVGAGEAAAAAALPAGPVRLTDRLAGHVAARLRRDRARTVGAGPTASTAHPDAAETDGDSLPVLDPTSASGGLHGSVLSTQTWKQAWEAATARRAAQESPAVPLLTTTPASAGTVDG
jgi:flagellar protein FliO/FliZ